MIGPVHSSSLLNDDDVIAVQEGALAALLQAREYQAQGNLHVGKNIRGVLVT